MSIPTKGTDPVHYINVRAYTTTGLTAGWYHWDESWSHRHGPYVTEETARDALECYVRSLTDGDEPSVDVSDPDVAPRTLELDAESQAELDAYAAQMQAERAVEEHPIAKLLREAGMRVEAAREETSAETLTAAYEAFYGRFHQFEKGEIVVPHPALGNLYKNMMGSRFVFCGYLNAQRKHVAMDPEAIPTNPAYGLFVDCMVGFFDHDGDFMIRAVESRRLQLEVTEETNS